MDADGVAGAVFNVAAGERTSLKRLIELVGEITCRSLTPRYEDPASREATVASSTATEATPRSPGRRGEDLQVHSLARDRAGSDFPATLIGHPSARPGERPGRGPGG